jgi:hypothetical protein
MLLVLLLVLLLLLLFLLLLCLRSLVSVGRGNLFLLLPFPQLLSGPL